MTRVRMPRIFAATLCGALPLCAVADGYTTQAIIDGNAASNAQGVLGVNIAAGDANLQSNATAIAIGDNSGQAAAQASGVQVIDSGQFSVSDVAVANINGAAFGNAAGIIGINQAAGAANAQGNSVAIAIGLEVTADAELAQNVSGVALPTLATEAAYREATVAETAFSNAHGIVQINQAAGMGNATGNSFSLRIQMGAP